MTLESGGDSNKEADYRLESATLFHERISNTVSGISADEINKMEYDLGGLHESRRLIMDDMACIKNIMDANIWYDEATSKLEKKTKSGN